MNGSMTTLPLAVLKIYINKITHNAFTGEKLLFQELRTLIQVSKARMKNTHNHTTTQTKNERDKLSTTVSCIVINLSRQEIDLLEKSLLFVLKQNMVKYWPLYEKH